MNVLKLEEIVTEQRTECSEQSVGQLTAGEEIAAQAIQYARAPSFKI
jgi:hypothetical protein